MPMIAALCVALLRALSLAAPIRLHGGSDAASVESVRPGAERGVSARLARIPDESLRIAFGFAGNALARVTGATTRGAPPTAVFVVASWPRPKESSVADAFRRRETASHAIATRGSLLPYFPTAPPLEG